MMNICRKWLGNGFAAIATGALMFFGGGIARAGESRHESVTDIAEMRAHMSEMRASLDEMREEPSGPESMLSMRKNACVKIGGRWETRYRVGWIQDANGAAGPGGTGNINDNTVYTYSGWDIKHAEVDLEIDFTEDTSAYVEFRFDAEGANNPVGTMVDKIFWTWSNIGGLPLAISVGQEDMPFGQGAQGNAISYGLTYGTDVTYGDAGYYSGWRRGNCLAAALAPGMSDNLTATGVRLDYEADDFVISAGVFSTPYDSMSLQDADWQAGQLWTSRNSMRNSGWANTALRVEWSPSMIEGLTVQSSFAGFYDAGQGGVNWPGGANYSPNWSAAIMYESNRWAIYAEWLMQWNPGFFRNAYANTLSLGADYQLTDKLGLTGMFDWGMLKGGSRGDLNQSNLIAAKTFEQHIRAVIAARYDFGNGIYAQAEYSHTWMTGWGFGDNTTKNADMVQLVTGVEF